MHHPIIHGWHDSWAFNGAFSNLWHAVEEAFLFVTFGYYQGARHKTKFSFLCQLGRELSRATANNA
jgi:hypothetical protein